MKSRNVLIFPAGTEIGLEILNALQHCKETKVFGAGQDLSTHGKFAFPEYHTLPSIHESNWAGELISLCKKLNIDYIFPAYDDVIIALSRVCNIIPATIISSSAEICELTRSKSATYERLRKIIRVPQLYESQDNNLNYPLFVKPDRGQGSVSIRKVFNYSELASAITDTPNAIICEFLPGDEYTVDCFSDRDNGLLYAGVRIRNRLRNGIAVNTAVVELPEARKIADAINRELKLRGAWFFQLKRASSNELTLLEIAPRISGSMAMNRVLGVNFPLLSIFEHERLRIDIHPNITHVEMDRALSNRYIHNIQFGVMYVDLDDTLILNGLINIRIIKLIYQCINKQILVKLLTKHQGDLEKILKKFRLNGLFDKIIHVKSNEKKSDFIHEQDAILVDDSFSERMEVSARCNIPTFDCSMIEILTQEAEFLNKVKIDEYKEQ